MTRLGVVLGLVLALGACAAKSPAVAVPTGAARVAGDVRSEASATSGTPVLLGSEYSVPVCREFAARATIGLEWDPVPAVETWPEGRYEFWRYEIRVVDGVSGAVRAQLATLEPRLASYAAAIGHWCFAVAQTGSFYPNASGIPDPTNPRVRPRPLTLTLH